MFICSRLRAGYLLTGKPLGKILLGRSLRSLWRIRLPPKISRVIPERPEALRGRKMLTISLLGFGILVWVSPVNAITFTDKVFICRNCGFTYQDKVIASTNTFGGQDSEFRLYVCGPQPLAYIIHTCHNCGYPDESSLTQPPNAENQTEANNKDKLMINNYLISYCKNNNITPDSFLPYQKYEILANIYALRGMASINIAEAYINAAWIADDEGNQEKSGVYRSKAIDYLIKALENQEIKADKVPVIVYLTGEICRRSSRFNQALEFFSLVKTDDPQLERLCEQQKELARKRDQGKSFIISPPPRLENILSPDLVGEASRGGDTISIRYRFHK